MKQPEQRLRTLRGRIDRADRRLLKALGERFEAAREIGRLKAAHDLAVHQKGRWAEVVKDRLRSSREMGLRKKFVTALLAMIHEESLDLQRHSGKKRGR